MSSCTITTDLGERRTAVVHVAGRIDLRAAPALKRELLAAAEQAKTVVADLTQAELVDSTTLGVLLAATRRLSLQGASLTVVCGGPLLWLVRRTMLDEVLDVVPAAADDPAPAVAAA